MLQPFKLPPREDAFPREQFCATGGQTFIGEQHLAFCSFLTICFSTQVLNYLVPKKSSPESRKWFVQEILIKTLKKIEKLLLIKNIRSMAFSKLFVRNDTGKKSSVFPSSTFRVLWVFFFLAVLRTFFSAVLCLRISHIILHSSFLHLFYQFGWSMTDLIMFGRICFDDEWLCKSLLAKYDSPRVYP